jgi:PAS domain S-box-containing protein
MGHLVNNLVAVLENTSESIWSVDTDYLITFANKVFIADYEKAFGIVLSPGTYALAGLPEELATLWKSRYESVFQERSRLDVVDHYALPYGSFYYSITLQPIIEADIVVGATIFSRDITEQKQAENELIKTKEVLEQSSEMAKVGAFEINTATNEVTWSKVMRKIHEVPDELEITIAKGIEFFFEQDRVALEAAVNRACTYGLEHDGEHQIRTYTGKKKWVRVIVRSKFNGAECFRIYGTVQDITDRKWAFELQQQFIQEAPSAIAMFDKQMKYLACSKKWKEDYKITDIDVVDKSHYDVFPEIREEWKNIHQVCLLGESMGRDEDIFIRKDGSVEWIRWRIKPWHNPSGEIGGIIMLTENITARKLATFQAIQFSKIFEKALNEIYIIDAETYHFKQVNAAAVSNLGYSKEELRAMIPSDIIPNLTEEGLKTLLKPLLGKSGEKVIIQETHQRKDGTLYPVEAHIQYVVVENESFFICFILDISEKSKYLNAIEEQNSILREIAWVQSHVLRAPLSRMMMLLMLLENEDITFNENDLLRSKKDVLLAIADSANELDQIIVKIISKTKVIEDTKPVINPSQKITLAKGQRSFEVILVDKDELSQLVNRYSIIQHGLHQKPLQFIDFDSVSNYLLSNDQPGKIFLILVDVTLREYTSFTWLELLHKTKWKGTVYVGILRANDENLMELDQNLTHIIGVFKTPLKKQQIEQLRRLTKFPDLRGNF